MIEPKMHYMYLWSDGRTGIARSEPTAYDLSLVAERKLTVICSEGASWLVAEDGASQTVKMAHLITVDCRKRHVIDQE